MEDYYDNDDNIWSSQQQGLSCKCINCQMLREDHPFRNQMTD